MDQKPPRDDEVKSGKLISFPGGRSVDTTEVGTDFVVTGVPTVPTAELLDPEAVEKEVREREQYVKKQELVQATDRGASTAELIDLALKEIAEESAHLKFERRKATRDGKNTASFTVMRIGALRQLTEVLLKRKEAALAERLDLKSPRFQKILLAWMEFVHSSMQKSGIEDEDIDVVFKQMRADMLDWEKKIVDVE
jgi:hypothetical protein